MIYPHQTCLADLYKAVPVISLGSVHYLSCHALPSFFSTLHLQIKLTLNE